MYPDGIGKEKPQDPLPGFDWEMWLGRRAWRPYQRNIAPYYFRWWSNYSSQMGNWGVHYLDVIRWFTGETAPTAVTAIGGNYEVDHDRDIPDTMTTNFEMPSKFQIEFQINEACHARSIDNGEIELRGSQGRLIADQDGYRVVLARPGQFQTWEPAAIAQWTRCSTNLPPPLDDPCSRRYPFN
ncbi:MAG: hypothetical protein EA426_17475 [Spirochaetaceae bacterium]|nr:MAG: hypothetical protein EA426_17475 [Spirochaetaceae bacterium]